MITYPLDNDFIQSWILLRSRISEIYQRLSQYPIYALVLSIEIHKEKITKKEVKKRRLNHESRLKGRPHIHICLILYNNFLCPSISRLESSLRSSNHLDFDLQTTQYPPDDSTKGQFHTKNWFLYCLKEAKDITSQRFLKKYLNIDTSSILFSGHPNSFDACADLTSIFNQCQYNLQHTNQGPPNVREINFLNQIPFIPQTNSEVVKVSHFLEAVLNFFDLAIWPGKTHLCQLRPGAKATWQECVELSELYTMIIKRVPIKTQELLMQSRAFNLYTREYHRLNFNWLPQVTIAGHLIELSDGIYNLRTGKFTSHDYIDLGLVSCSTFLPDITFQGLPWPEPCIEIMTRLKFQKEIIPYREKHKTITENKIDYFVFKEYAILFSNLFHLKKQNDRVIFLQGYPGVGKYILIEQVLRSVIQNHSIGIISNTKGEYQFTPLKNKLIGIANEFSSEYINILHCPAILFKE